MRNVNIILITIIFLLLANYANAQKPETRPPNIIFILSDDLSWGDLGCYGQKKIKTPNIDRIAREGMKFTQAYAGNSVCAPSRSSLMQGLHPGHARVRGNEQQDFRESLQPGDLTVASVLKQANYKTGLFGKWGLSLHNQPGVPNKMGFDEFFGYLNQRQAHTYYPEFLYHNQERVYYPENASHYKLENYLKQSPYDQDGKVLPNGIKNPAKAKNSFDVYSEKSLEFVRENKNNPFFLYLAYTIPHGPLIVPDLGEYKDKDWPIQHKEWAAMITRMDTEVGKLLKLIDELGLDENTIIFFASDNGNSTGYENRYLKEKSGPSLVDFFDLASPTRGKKGDSYNGAFHVPAVVRWPGKIAPDQVSDQIWAFWDFLPTAAEIAGIQAPSDIDGISILPTLLGKGKQKQHDYLYWEFIQNQAVRKGKWFAHRANGGEIELYDLISDPQQSRDLSSTNSKIVKKVEQIMGNAHTPSDVWPSPGESPEEFKKRLKENNISERPNNISVY
jgi:arylsulfatase A-like enzyme